MGGGSILEQQDLQRIISKKYRAYLKKHRGKRPRNPESTHTAIRPDDLAAFRDGWAVVTKLPQRQRQ
jgi:hypothetical protein